MSAGTALVTGAAGGLGRAIAARLAADGHALLLVDRDATVEQVAAMLPGSASCVVDLGDPQAAATVAEAVRALGRPLHALVNNAGVTRDARATELRADAFAEVVQVDLAAPIALTLGLRDLFADGAAVVNISSRAALGNFGQANYVAAKAGLVGFTRALALQWAPRVRVNAVAPGLIDTPMTRAMPERVRDKLVARIPAGRIGTAADVAEAVAFLASERSGYVTGQTLLCCGGRSIGA